MELRASMLLVGSLFVTPAHTKEAVYSCENTVDSDKLRFADADQVAIDLENQSVDLRVARTMGTSKPVNWKFWSHKTALDDDSFAVKRMPDGTWVGGGIYGAAGHAFELNNGTLTWTVVLLGENWTLRWKCKP